MMSILKSRLVLLAPALLGGLACSNANDSNPIAPAALVSSPSPIRGELTVCKVGSNANFSLAVIGVSQGGFALTDGQCALVWTQSGPADNVTVTEIPSTATLDSIVGAGIRGSISDAATHLELVCAPGGTTRRGAHG